MDNDDKKVFLNSEIVDEDRLAPTGVLLDSSEQSDDDEELEMLDELDEIVEEPEEELTAEDEIIEDDELIEDIELIEEDELIEEEELVEELDEDVEDADLVEKPEEPIEDNFEGPSASQTDEQSYSPADEQPVLQASKEQAESSQEPSSEPIAEEPANEEPAQKQTAKPAKKATEKKPSTKTQSKKPTVRTTVESKYDGESDDKLDPYKSKRNAANEGVWAAAAITVKKSSKKKETAEADDETAPKPAKKSTKKPAADASEQKNVTADGAASNVQKEEAPAAKVPAEKKTTAKKEDKNMSNDEEKVLIEADETKPQHGKFVIKKTDKGNFVYKLYSSNKRVLAVPGGAYKDLASCKGGIQSVINNAATAPIEDQTLKKPVEQKCPKWEIYLDNKNEFRLRLIASNGNVVAITNDGYMGKDAAKKGIDAIARAAQGASVVRNDSLW